MEQESHNTEVGAARPAFQEALQEGSKAMIEYVSTVSDRTLVTNAERSQVIPFKVAHLREETAKTFMKLKVAIFTNARIGGVFIRIDGLIRAGLPALPRIIRPLWAPQGMGQHQTGKCTYPTDNLKN